MGKIPTAADVAKKYVERAAAAGPDYEKGVRGAGPDWLAQTVASEEIWSAGVQDAISRGAFGKGASKSGAAHYEQKALKTGAARYPGGIRDGLPDFTSGIEPVLEVVRTTTLSPRRMTGDPGNIRRVEELAQAQRRAKLARS